MIDKNQAIIDYITKCPKISNNPLFFNFINAKDENKQIITLNNDIAIDTSYIDGSIMKRYTFTIIDFKSITYNPIIKIEGYSNENVDDMLDSQGIIDWVNEQNNQRHFPDFGEDCIIDNIIALSNNPNMNGVDTSINPPLAKYSISIQVEYLDTSKVIWGK